MNKVIAWVLSFSKLDKVVSPVQKFLSGYKTYLTGAGIAVPAFLVILQNFSDQGMAYLLGLPHTTEWLALLNGLGIMFVRAAITKAADPSKDPNAQDAAKVG